MISENKSLVRKKLITCFKKLTSGFWDLAKISWKTTDYFHFNQWFLVNFWLSPKNHWLISLHWFKKINQWCLGLLAKISLITGGFSWNLSQKQLDIFFNQWFIFTNHRFKPYAYSMHASVLLWLLLIFILLWVRQKNYQKKNSCAQKMQKATCLWEEQKKNTADGNLKLDL